MNQRGPSVLCAMALAWLAQGASPEQELMLEKLGAAQKILQGLSTEDYEVIRRNAVRLGTLGEHAAMRASPAAAALSPAFRRESRRLAEAARQRKIDAAAEAFAAVTKSCVECHKAVRGEKASLSRPFEGAFVAAYNLR